MKKSFDSKFLAPNSNFVTTVCDLAFAYNDGNKVRPTPAASVALRGLLSFELGWT
jgi:hypothetical protein